MRQVLISNILDATDDVISQTKSSASLNNVVGILAQVRTYLLRDNDGKYSPFTNRGFFARNQWRNQNLDETNDDGNKIFSGAIYATGERRDDFGFTTKIDVREPLSVILNFKVDENDIFEQDGITGLSKYKVNNAGGYPAGHSGPITVDYQGVPSGNVEAPIPSLVAFTDSLIPRYQVLSQTSAGAPLETVTITLDRPLESALADDQDLRITTAVDRSGAGAIRRALISVGLSDRIGASFSQIDAVDVANSRTIRMHILSTDNVTLKQHIDTLLELSDLYLTFNPNTAIIDVVRGLEWDGVKINERVTDKELIGPINIDYDFSNLIFAYDLFFANGSEIGRAQGEVAQEIVDDWANLDPWAPLKPGGTFVMGEKYLYSNSGAADFFGLRRLDFYGQPRIIVTSPVKQSIHGNPEQFLNIQLVKSFSLSVKTSNNDFFAEQPSRIMAFNFDEDNQLYTGVKFMLTNIPSPNIARISTFPLTPT